MVAEDVKALREELGCTARELAGALGLEPETVLAWERGELFPTKQFADRMEALRAAGPSAVPRKRRGSTLSPLQLLADPDLWRLLRKLLAHSKLREAAQKLADPYDDPID